MKVIEYLRVLRYITKRKLHQKIAEWKTETHSQVVIEAQTHHSMSNFVNEDALVGMATAWKHQHIVIGKGSDGQRLVTPLATRLIGIPACRPFQADSARDTR
jgi:hypothetical protein